MKYYFAYDNSGRVASYSKGENVTDTLKQIQIDVDTSILDQGSELWIIDGKLIAKDSGRIITENKNLDIEKDKKVLIDKGGNATIEEIINFITKYL